MAAHKGCQKKLHGEDFMVSKKNGKRYCGICLSLNKKHYDFVHREQKRLYQRENYKKNSHLWKEAYIRRKKDGIIAKYKESAKSRIRELGHIHRLKSYNLTLSEYNKMCESQKNLCAICLNISQKKRLAVDHNHETGKIRGLLCEACNQTLGKMKENPETLRRAATYLE